MRQQLKEVVETNGARTGVMDATTITLTDGMAAVASGTPLFLSGMVTRGLMESLWRDGLLRGT
jgi:hypothetical protein